MLKGKNKEGGFTLIEVLITILVFTVGLSILLSVFVYGFNLLSRMKQTALASQCAQEEIELIRNMAFDEILNLETSFINDSLSLLRNSRGTLTIEDSEGDDIKKLTVSVIWAYRGRQRQKDVVTYITRKGINKK